MVKTSNSLQNAHSEGINPRKTKPRGGPARSTLAGPSGLPPPAKREKAVASLRNFSPFLHSRRPRPRRGGKPENLRKLNSRDGGEPSTGNTSMAESWEEIWERSQSSLEAIRNSISTLTSPTPRVLRVSQLDAESLDAELVQLLQEPITKALSVVNVRPLLFTFSRLGR